MFNYVRKVEQRAFSGGTVVVRELLSREVHELQKAHGESQGLDFCADVVRLGLVEPSFSTVEDAKAALMELPPKAVTELVELVAGFSGLGGKN